MSLKLELSITKDYVSSWGLKEAIREIFQNAIDQQTTDPENFMFCSYEAESEILRIGNSKSSLSRQSLLLGETSKRSNSKTIGQFGEGYKLALLVLTRLGYKVNILNYGSKERWIPKIQHSRKYNTKVLTIMISKFIFTSVPHNNLEFEIHGITKEDYEQVVRSNLHLQSTIEDDVVETSIGRILLGEDHRHRLYVNGLYICENKNFHYGYDFKPASIQLDRDRSLISDFDLSWTTSTMWLELTDSRKEYILGLLYKDAPDVKYVTKASFSKNPLTDIVHNEFRNNHGDNAVPVESQEEMVEVKRQGLTPVVVTPTVKELITTSDSYTQPPRSAVSRTSPKDHLFDFLNKWQNCMNQSMYEEFVEIIELSNDWDWS